MALTVTEENTTGASYTVVLETQPAADVTVTVAGHAGTDVSLAPDPPTLAPDPPTLTFTPQNWEYRPDDHGDRCQRCRYQERYGDADPQRGEHRHWL